MRTILAFIAAIIISLASCTTTKYVPLQSEKIDSTAQSEIITESRLREIISEFSQTSTRVDSVVIRDSVIYIINEQGDVVGKEIYHDKTSNTELTSELEKMQATYDSLLSSINYNFSKYLSSQEQQIVEVEKSLTFWQRLLIYLGEILLSTAIILLIHFAYKYRSKILGLIKRLF